MNKNRHFLAILIAPFIPILYFIVLAAFSGSASALVMVPFLIIFAYLPCLLVGGFLILAMSHFNKLNIFSLILYGTILGVVVMLLSMFLASKLMAPSVPFSYEQLTTSVLWGGAFGFIVSLSYGLIAGLPLKNKK